MVMEQQELLSYRSSQIFLVSSSLSDMLITDKLAAKYDLIVKMMVSVCSEDGVGVCLGRGVISAPRVHFHLPTNAFLLKYKELDIYLFSKI